MDEDKYKTIYNDYGSQITQPQPNQDNGFSLPTQEQLEREFNNRMEDKGSRRKRYTIESVVIPGLNPEDENNYSATNDIMKQYSELVCNYCNEKINEDESKIMIGSCFYHINHLLCCNCGVKLDDKKILELSGNIYCGNCFDQECDLGRNLCGYCNKEISGDAYIKALDRVWHPNHFFCSHCGCKFDCDQPFYEYDGKPYCEEDYSRLFGKICRYCNEIITNEYIEAMDMFWHVQCFNCEVCKESLNGKTYFCLDGVLYCEKHYQEKEGLLCEYCKKPVEKRYISALNKKWHPNHFFCNYCKKVLYSESTGFKEHDKKPYCSDCFIRLYG